MWMRMQMVIVPLPACLRHPPRAYGRGLMVIELVYVVAVQRVKCVIRICLDNHLGVAGEERSTGIWLTHKQPNYEISL